MVAGCSPSYLDAAGGCDGGKCEVKKRRKRRELSEEENWKYGDAANPFKGTGPGDQTLDSAMKWPERALHRNEGPPE